MNGLHLENENTIFFAANLLYPFCKRWILSRLGDKYEEFFQYLGLTPEEIQVARINKDQNADGAILELWNK